MKGHIKVSLKQDLYNFSPILAPIKIKKIQVNRNAHFAKVKASLVNALNSVKKENEISESILSPEDIPKNIILTFKDNPDINERLVIKSLDSHGMSLLSVKKTGDRYIANVSIPKNKIEKIKEIVEDYGKKEQGKHGNPKNKALIESISEIEFGNIDAVWFGDKPLPEDKSNIINVELWLDISLESSDDVEKRLHRIGELFGITIFNDKIKFKDRLVKIVCASVESLEMLYKHMPKIAEIRPANTITLDFLDMKPAEQFNWVNNLTYTNSENITPICILDTGLNYAHPLLKLFTAPDCVITAEPQWTPTDLKGHGTGIAGLAIFGDLKFANQTNNLEISASLESVKILPDQGINDPKLYGAVTTDAVYSIESINPVDRRIYAMAVTSEYNLRGAPSSWSAKIDELSSGTPEDDSKRLFIISAGNMTPQLIVDYP
ncbi:TPA: S8 family peptidase, partial [Yersinia enterocolitica]|nr:S8 family peptidase [Yersinia enterocolitica]